MYSSEWSSVLWTLHIYTRYTRGVQKVRRLTQLIVGYVHHILPLFNMVSCNCNALGLAFLQNSDSVIEELLILPF